MIIYNVTVNIDSAVHDEWLQWMKKVHIPEVMKTGIFTENRICRVLGTDEEEGFTYAVQYSCKNMKDFEKYNELHAPALKAKYNEKYEGKYLAYRSLLKVV